jgi:peptidylprolyl isomerase
MPSLRHLLLAALTVLALSLAACGDDESGAGSESAGAETTTQAEAAAEEKTKPVIETPSGKPPTKLEQEDLTEGTGPEAKDGDLVTVQYAGVAWSTGEEFDASWNRGEPFQFTLGAGEVISGWDQGVKGMKVGGRRQLTIPPDLAYGPGGSPPAIGPDETLVFVVDLEQVG